MGDTVKITDLKCPGCGGILKMPTGNARTVQCEYCGNQYIIDAGQGTGQNAPLPGQAAGGRQIPQWEPVPRRDSRESASRGSVMGTIVSVICLVILVGVRAYYKAQNQEAARQAQQREMWESMADSYTRDFYGAGAKEEEEERAGLSGMLEKMVVYAFGKDSDSVTQEELDQIQWIADKTDLDNTYLGYSFENPLENPDAQLEWLTFPRGSDKGYTSLYMFGGLKKLETGGSLSQCDLGGLPLESLSASYSALGDVVKALEDTATIRQLSIGSSVKNLEGLELFPNLESLTIDAGSLNDVNAVVALEQLKSLTIQDGDAINDFAVFASMENLAELYIESENLKTLDFLQRMPWLQSLGLAGGKLLSLDGIEALEGLEKLSVTDCRELREMDAVSALESLTELYLEKPYECEEPSLAGLSGLRSLTLDNFDACSFLPGLTALEELTLHSCDLAPGLDLSGLTRLKSLTCTTFYQDMPLAFAGDISSLEYVNLSGIMTFDDISGIFRLPGIREIVLNGTECEIDFDRMAENTSLESLEMAGIKLHDNVKVYNSGGMTDVYWDDVFIKDQLDFLGNFPNLKRLDIADNEITDLEFVGSLVNLEEINFADNYVTDMRALASIPTLRLVKCSGNPISNLRVLDESHIQIINE